MDLRVILGRLLGKIYWLVFASLCRYLPAFADIGWYLPETKVGRKAFAGICCCLLLFAGWEPARQTLRTFVV